MMHNKAKTTPTFRRHFTNSSPYAVHHYAHMFCDDISLGIFPLGRRYGSTSDFSAAIEGPGDEVERAKHVLRSFDDFASNSHENLIRNTITSLSKDLAHNGSCHFEILKVADNFHLSRFPNEHLLNIHKFYIQFVPKEDRSAPRQYFSLLPNSLVWKLGMPASLGGSREHTKIINKLREIPPTLPDFAEDYLRDLSTQHNNTFDFRNYQVSTNQYILLLTQKWGWNNRQYGTEFLTEFTHLHRELRFRRSKILLRDHIINEISNLLFRLKINARLEISGLRTANELDQIIQNFESGELPFEKVIDILFEEK